MKAALGETHPLVQLTLACLEFDQEDRPSAMVVLRGLEVGTTLPQNCPQTKLELIQQKEEIQQVAAEKQAQINWLQQQIFEKHAQIDQLQASNDRLQAEKRKQVHGLEELTTLQ